MAEGQDPPTPAAIPLTDGFETVAIGDQTFIRFADGMVNAAAVKVIERGWYDSGSGPHDLIGVSFTDSSVSRQFVPLDQRTPFASG